MYDTVFKRLHCKSIGSTIKSAVVLGHEEEEIVGNRCS